MKLSIQTLFSLFVVLAATTSFATQPNIVFILADDMGFADTSNTLTTLNNPSDYYETPAIDRLASEGMAFTNAYSSGVNCAPTRSAILTGQYAQRPTNNIYNVDNLNRGGSSTMLVGPSQGLPTGTDAIPNNAITYAEVLQQQGYTTAHFGKFHVVEAGTNAASDIVNYHGFDENYGGSSAGNPSNYFANASGSTRTFGGGISESLDPYAEDYTMAYVQDNILPYANGTSTSAINALVGTRKHVSDGMTDAALEFMEREKAGPFLLQFNPYAVHTPIQGRSDLVNKYQLKPAGIEDSNAGFGALLEGMDQNIARIIDYLENTADPNNPGQNLDENTIVVFMSDNGGALSQSNVGDFKGEKGELDEGGIRVPMIAWSGNSSLVDGGTVNHTPVASFDMYKTFANYGEANLGSSPVLDGEDLVAVFADANHDLGRDDIYWHFPGYLVSGGRNQRPQTAMRSDDWKLLYNYEDQSFELYDLATDTAEANNLAGTRDDIVSILAARMMNWLNATDAPLATLRSGTININLDGSYYADDQIYQLSGSLQIQAGEEVPFVLGDLLVLSDLNSDGMVNIADWLAFRSGQTVDMTSLSVSQAFSMGDLDGDKDNDLNDFILFKQSYESVNGANSFAALFAVPEPSTSSILILSLSLISCLRQRRTL